MVCASAALGLHYIQGIEMTEFRDEEHRSHRKELSVAVLPSSLPYDTPPLNRVLTWRSLTAMGVGATIGGQQQPV